MWTSLYVKSCRRRFVQHLRRVALAEPNVTVIQATVSKLLEESGRVVGVEYKVEREVTNEAGT
jgi:tRNA U34 5-carboxymethylaminomethyl modifying enzyme MnmG/GidA